MTLTPEDLLDVQLKTRRGKYASTVVDELLDQVRTAYEAIWNERADLHRRVERLTAEADVYRAQEKLVANVLLAAEGAAAEVRERANEEAEEIVRRALAEAEEIGRAAKSEQVQLQDEIRRLESLRDELRSGYRAFLLAGLDLLEEDAREPALPAAPAKAKEEAA